MTKLERLMLINQYLILEKITVDKDEKAYYIKYREILENGYALDYEDLTIEIKDELSVSECQKVFDILCMFGDLYRSYNNLDDKSEFNLEDISFKGFSLKFEEKYYNYAKYLIETCKKFDESKLSDYDSKCPKMCKYEIMLDVWEKYRNCEFLTKLQIKQIINAKF